MPRTKVGQYPDSYGDATQPCPNEFVQAGMMTNIYKAIKPGQ